jgi:hypothetical protein
MLPDWAESICMANLSTARAPAWGLFLAALGPRSSQLGNLESLWVFDRPSVVEQGFENLELV